MRGKRRKRWKQREAREARAAQQVHEARSEQLAAAAAAATGAASAAEPRRSRLRRAPRKVPWRVSSWLLFGGRFAQMGWLFCFAALLAFGRIALGDDDVSSDGIPVALLMLLAGVGIVCSRVVRGLPELRLLRFGRETTGKLIGHSDTGDYVDGSRLMALTFEYEARGKTHTATVKTTAPERLQDDAREAMLYDPKRPANATTLDHLPGSPRINAQGDLEARGSLLPALVVPILVGVLVLVVVAAEL